MWQTYQTAFLIFESHMTQFRIQYCYNLDHDIKLSFTHSFSQTLFKLSINTRVPNNYLRYLCGSRNQSEIIYRLSNKWVYTEKNILIKPRSTNKMHFALISIELSWIEFLIISARIFDRFNYKYLIRTFSSIMYSSISRIWFHIINFL